MNIDAERQAAEIRIRAEVKTGELLSGSEKAKNQHPSAGSATRPAQTLSVIWYGWRVFLTMSLKRSKYRIFGHRRGGGLEA